MLLIFQDFENIVFENWLSEYSFGKLAFCLSLSLSLCVCVCVQISKTKQIYTLLVIFKFG